MVMETLKNIKSFSIDTPPSKNAAGENLITLIDSLGNSSVVTINSLMNHQLFKSIKQADQLCISSWCF